MSIDQHRAPELATYTALDAAWVAALARGDTDEAARLEPLVNNPHREPSRASLPAAALWYAERGWPIFPCQAGGKQPACSHGFKDATTDAAQVRAWWADMPEANIALPTGEVSGLDVFDFDGDPAGVQQFQDAAVDGQDLPPLTGISITPRGMHLYVPAAGVGNKAGIYSGVDYRGTEGYVIVPPSGTPAGNYRWLLPPERW